MSKRKPSLLIQHDEHTRISGVDGKKVFVIDSQGNVVDFGGSSNWALDVQEKSDDANIEYIGKAAIGSSTADEVWQIMKVDCTTGTVITWADSNENFDNEFDERENLSYG